MRIELLKEFVTLAQTLNFRKASEKHYITQSTLTRHIRELEEHCGARLFDRDTQTVAITRDGAQLLERARLICELYDEMIREFEQGRHDTLTVGVPLRYRFYSDLVRFTIERISAEATDFNCKVVDVGIAPEPSALLEKGFDVVLSSSPEKFSGGDLESIPLCDRRLCLWVSTKNPLAERSSVSITELGGMVLRPCTSDSRYFWLEVVRRIFNNYGTPLVVGEAADDFYQLGSHDFALIFGGAPDPALGLGVREVPIDERLFETVAAIYRRSHNSAALQSFIAALRQTARELGAE